VITYDTAQRGEYLRNVSLALIGGPETERAYFQPESSLFGAGGSVPGWTFLIPLASIVGLVSVSLRNIERRYRTGHLSVVKGRASRKEVDITTGLTLGRDERNVIGLFKDDEVEQYHADVKRDNGRYFIKDKGTASGTFVNREKISGEHMLTDGDVITIGGFKIVFSQGHQRSCPGCGNPVRSVAKFCPHCGVKTA